MNAESRVTVTALRDGTAALLRRVESGERIQIAVRGRPVAELAPVRGRRTWVPRRLALAALRQADPGLCADLDEAMAGPAGL